jgi:predicted HTH transcriptional regulator
MEMVEKIGSGIKRMKDEMARANLPEPAFGLEGFFTVMFYRPMELERWVDSWQPLLTTWLLRY